jgi:DNA-binding NtrC family response regulator
MTTQSAQTVLLVDSEPLVLDVCRAVLDKSGYRVLCSPTGRTGLELFRGPTAVYLVVSDMRMVDLSGPDMTGQMVAEKPDTKVVYLSGDGYEPEFRETRQGALNLLEKPFTSEQFLRIVRQALDTKAARA